MVDHPRLSRRRRLLRPGRPEHGARRRPSRAATSSTGRSTGAPTASRTTAASGPRRGREDPTIAYDYYWGGKPVNGKTFDGFVTPEEAAFLSDVRARADDGGLVHGPAHRDPGPAPARAQGDLRRALARRPADRGVRQLGLRRRPGDDERTPATRSAPGWSGSTRRSRSRARLRRRDGAERRLGLRRASGAAPYINAPPLTPETIQVPTVFGVGAYFDPQGTDLTRRAAAHDRTSTSPSARCSPATPRTSPPAAPDIRDFTLTNEVTLAGVLDDNSAPLSFLRASVGQSVGGPLVDKNFPAPERRLLALPEDPATPLYSWEDYDEVGAPGHPVELNDEGAAVHRRARARSPTCASWRATFFEAPRELHRAVLPDPDPHRRRGGAATRRLRADASTTARRCARRC